MERVWDWIVSNSIVLITLLVVILPYVILIGIIVGIVLLIRHTVKKKRRDKNNV